MRDLLRQIIKRPWALAGLLLAIGVVVGLVLFVVQVVSFARDIKAGKPDPFTARQHEASLTNILSQKPLTNLDLSRVETHDVVPMLGNPEAKIHIVEFLDYQCPFCSHSAPEIRLFMNHHADDVLFEVRDFPLESIHDRAMDAAIAARCVFAQGNADRYWRYHDILFASQNDLGDATLRANAQTVGADLATFDACVKARIPESSIRSSLEDGVAAGVRGTPTFFVNGYRIQGALEQQDLEEIVAKMKQRL
ncbi:MAG: thioredoxin domain-containing protein [Patescibacteria group bacterium]